MVKLLFIGSAVADVMVRIPHLPVTGEDLHVSAQQTSLGGCACNAFFAARATHLAECTLYAPVGTGVWADFVRSELKRRGVQSAAPEVTEPNGCCYCLVESTGERTFLSQHGAEYHFYPEWMADLDLSMYDGVYLCGLEAEEPVSGEVLVSALETSRPGKLFFAPGPRIDRIDPVRLNRIWQLHPVLHMNEEEACGYTGCGSVQEAAIRLNQLTGNAVYITIGATGVYAYSEACQQIIPAEKAEVVNTVGAGDAHIGTLMACLCAGMEPAEAAARANQTSARVVAQAGAILEEDAD